MCQRTTGTATETESGRNWTEDVEYLNSYKPSEIMDVGLVADVAVAVGTMSLAVCTFIIIKQGRSQLKELKKQIQLSLSKEEPRLIHSDVKFIGDEIRVRITNVGNGVAEFIGVTTNFQSWTKNTFLPSKFTLEENDAFPTECVSFPSNEEMILEPKRSKILKTKIRFLVSKTPSLELKHSPKAGGKAFHFKELSEFLEKQEIHKISMQIGLIGRNLVAKPTDVTSIAEFTAEFTKHKTLEEAFNEFVNKGKKMPIVSPLSLSELYKIGYLPGELYRNINRNEIEF